ncbi:MAG: hypothetical protein LBB21_03720 [Holosporaceae bacterium]|jgi:hypothetical protein|nr:hypothetical protein [Holosporaceae bacterium]
MLQNISAQRSNKRVTNADFARVNNPCHLDLPPFNSSSNKLKINTTLLCVRGTGNNRCKVMWSMFCEIDGRASPSGAGTTNSEGQLLTTSAASIFCGNSARIKKECDSTVLHPRLFIKAGEQRIIFETGYYYDTRWGGKPTFGFRLINPSPTPGTVGAYTKYFGTVVFFTPKSGLFDDNLP